MTCDLSPGDAGKRAAKQAAELINNNNNNNNKLESISTLLAHAGVDSDIPNAPMSPPIHTATTYTRPADGIYLATDSIYTREDNPTRLLLEKTVGQLECHGGDNSEGVVPTTCAFSSGMMAVSSIILAHQAPLRVVLPSDLYHGVPTLMATVFARFGVEVYRANYDNLSELENLVKKGSSSSSSSSSSDQPTTSLIVWMESPSNPKCQIIDIAAICNMVKPYSDIVTTVVDSTLSPPVIAQPLRLGADVVLHSGTKYLGGHSDVLLGIVTTSPWTERGRWLGPRLHEAQAGMGGVASPFDCWLTLRGLRTLHVRVRQQSQSALALAQFLETQHPLVTAVHYPGLTSHRRHDVACRQMSNNNYYFGGVLSLELQTEAMAMAVAGAVQTIQRATSLGGTETLIEHRASIEPPGRVTSPPGLLRISVGLEDADDLIRDLEQALQIAQQVVAGFRKDHK